MRRDYKYLKDENFLQKIDMQHITEQYAKITLLD